MPKLKLQRVPFTADADNRLRMMKARTGITPNLIARIGFCLSLEEPGTPTPLPDDTKAGRDINRFTLLGEYDNAFIALLTARMIRDDDSFDEMDSHFIAHMNRGVELVAARVKSLLDFGELVGK
jgi:DNA sulfur modification protein DndE